MKSQKNLLTTLLFVSICYLTFSQNSLTKLNKNINIDATGLRHELNATADSVYLHSTTQILRVSFLSHEGKSSQQIDIGTTEKVVIPLYHFEKGRYTVAVYTEEKIIAFDFNRLITIVKPDGAEDDLAESILRGSLSEEEQLARNMKPRKKPASVTPKPKEVIAKVSKPKVPIKKPVKSKQETVKSSPSIASSSSKPKKAPQKVEDTKRVSQQTVAKINKKKPVIKRPRVQTKPNPEVVVRHIKTNPKTQVADRETVKRPDVLNSRDKNRRNSTPKGPVKTTIGEKRVIEYDITTYNDGSVDKQSREDYRKNNLRPNGKKYD
ncbi:hypothetical protein [Lacinutrix salivirga]